MKKIVLFLLIFSSFYSNSQELLCNVQVNANQVQTSDRKIFQTLQTAVYEFINNTEWTNTIINNEERIECTILINITERISNDEFNLLNLAFISAKSNLVQAKELWSLGVDSVFIDDPYSYFNTDYNLT